MDKQEIYRGQLVWGSNGEESDLLGLVKENDYHVILVADELSHLARRQVTIRYFVADKPLTANELTHALIQNVSGSAKAEYWMRYSELTGYLWTTENLVVGGHDLILELKSHVGKFLHLVVEFGRPQN